MHSKESNYTGKVSRTILDEKWSRELAVFTIESKKKKSLGHNRTRLLWGTATNRNKWGEWRWFSINPNSKTGNRE